MDFRRFILILLVSIVLPVMAESPFDGHWQGTIDTPAAKLEINIDLVSDEESLLTGDISIPAQGVSDLPLIEVGADNDTVRFKLPDIPGNPAFEGKLSEDGMVISGTFTQAGRTMPFTLNNSEDKATLARNALADFDTLVEKAIEDFNVPGLGIAIVAGGEIIYARGFGYRDMENQLPMTPDTLFAIGSTTKAMTSTLLGLLSDEGIFDWDEPLRNYLPEFTLADPVISARITPRDLVTHRSGLPRHDMLWYNYNEGSRAEMISRFAHLELSADLREKWQYNNLMYMTAGYLAGHLSGTTWEDALREKLFLPLGMVRSNFRVKDMQADSNHALAYAEKDKQQVLVDFRPIDLVGPAGSVNSSVNEMALWLQFNLAGGKIGNKQLINPATIKDIHSPHMMIPFSPPRPDIITVGYGMGWQIDIFRGHRRVSHGGGIDGFITSVMLFPDDDLGIVSFVNSNSNLGAVVNQHAADRILGLEEVDWVGEALGRRTKFLEVRDEVEQKRDDMRVSKTRPSHSIEDYVGTYSDPGYGPLTISRGKGRYGLAMTFNDITRPLEHWHYDVWNGAETEGDDSFEDFKIIFRSNFEGEIDVIEAPFELLASPIVFKKQPDPRLFDAQYLQRYVATFQNQFNENVEQRITLSDNTLILDITGQPSYTLTPLVSGRFNIEGLQGFSVGFEEDNEGRIDKIIFYQPNGVFESKRIE